MTLTLIFADPTPDSLMVPSDMVRPPLVYITPPLLILGNMQKCFEAANLIFKLMLIDFYEPEISAKNPTAKWGPVLKFGSTNDPRTWKWHILSKYQVYCQTTGCVRDLSVASIASSCPNDDSNVLCPIHILHFYIVKY